MAPNLRQLFTFAVLAGFCAAGISHDQPKPLERRRTNGTRTCGFEDGDPKSPVTCPSGSHCAMQAILPETTSFYAGCCRDASLGGGGCYFQEACVAKTTTESISANSATLTCSGSLPSCVTYTWTRAGMMAFGCDTSGGTKTIELGPGLTTYSSASSKPTLGTSVGTGTSPIPSAGGGPGEGVLYGFTQSQRIGVIIACSLAVCVFGAGITCCLWIHRD